MAAGNCQVSCSKRGSLTLMYMVSLVLVMPCDSLSTMEKLSSLMRCPVLLEWSNISTSLPNVFHGTSWLVISVCIDDSSFVTNVVLVIGSYQ